MKKNGYILVFKQVQSMHLGIRGYGVLSETRIFITGQTMWGALTNTYGKNKKWPNRDNDENKKTFETISCFYPSFSENCNDVMMPKFKDGEFYLENYSEKDFRNEFVDSFMSTAILPTSLAAKDKSLHEMEVILPQSKSNENKKQKQLYWIGLLCIEENIKNNFLKKNELEIIVGGDSRYGLGRLKLEEIKEVNNEILEKWGVKGVNNMIFTLLLKKEKNDIVRIYNFLENKEYNFEGKLELFADLNFQNGAMPNAINPRLYIFPGSEVKTFKRNFKLKKGIYYINSE